VRIEGKERQLFRAEFATQQNQINSSGFQACERANHWASNVASNWSPAALGGFLAIIRFTLRLPRLELTLSSGRR
jgi:hypothetical protein